MTTHSRKYNKISDGKRGAKFINFTHIGQKFKRMKKS